MQVYCTFCWQILVLLQSKDPLHEVKNPPRAHKIQQNMLFTTRGRGSLLIMPHPLSGCQIKAEIKGFLLKYRLFCTSNGSFRKLEEAREFFFLKFQDFYEIAEIIFFKNFPPAFFNIVKEPLLVQKQMIHQ